MFHPLVPKDQVAYMNEVGTVLVSTHPDDVALSVGASILAGFFSRPLLLITVFSHGSGFAPYYQGNKSTESIDELRKMEDSSFAAAIGARRVQLGLTDAGTSEFGRHPNRMRWALSVVRGNVTRINAPPRGVLAEGFEPVLVRLARTVPLTERWILAARLSRLDMAYAEIKRRLSQILSASPDSTVLSPLALGLHPDHVLVAMACTKVAGRSRLRYYEDLPYAYAYRQSGILRHVMLLNRKLRPIGNEVEGSIQGKLDNMRLYSSQLRPDDFRKVVKYAKGMSSSGRAYERIWKYSEDST